MDELLDALQVLRLESDCSLQVYALLVELALREHHCHVVKILRVVVVELQISTVQFEGLRRVFELVQVQKCHLFDCFEVAGVQLGNLLAYLNGLFKIPFGLFNAGEHFHSLFIVRDDFKCFIDVLDGSFKIFMV